MNLLGKILIILIFIMSILFMSFSVTVYMTHNEWKTKASETGTQLQTARNQNDQLKSKIEEIRTEYASERAARTNVVALLETRARKSENELGLARQRLSSLESDARQAQARVDGTITTLDAVKKKVDALRDTVKRAQADRDKVFQDVVDLKGQVLALEATRERLAARNDELTERLGSATAVLRANNLTENTPIANVPPPRDGKVQQVDRENRYVVLTLGSDDGVRREHKLDVVRGGKYLGRVQITKTYSDRAVARVLDGYRKGAIRVGDGVRTKTW